MTGVDGCPGGWVIAWVAVQAPLRLLSVRVAADFADVLARTKECAAVGIDVPIGLMDEGRRAPDVEARKVLHGRASCIFPAVIRPALGIADYRAACDASERAQGKRISKQAFTLGLRSDQVDRLMTPDLQERVVEVHPEVCFWALNDHMPVMTRKRSPAGAEERLALLARWYADDLTAVEPPPGAARDDLLDACAAAWTAARHARGESERLPPLPDTDARGLRMEIVY